MKVSHRLTKATGSISPWKEFHFLFCYKTKTTREMKMTFEKHDQTSYESKGRERLK